MEVTKGGGAFRSNLEGIRSFSDTGYKKRDFSIPETLDYKNYMMPVRDQGDKPTCVAQTFSAIMEYQLSRTDGEYRYNSPMFIYNLRSNAGDGMNGKDLERIGTQFGICSETIFPYIAKNYQVTPPKEAFEEAKLSKIKDLLVLETIDDVKKFLVYYGPCYMAFPLYNFGPYPWMKGEENYGGHAVCITGFDKRGFLIRNSWGTAWAEGGYSHFPYDQFGSQWEILGFINEKPYGPLLEKQKCCALV